MSNPPDPAVCEHDMDEPHAVMERRQRSCELPEGRCPGPEPTDRRVGPTWLSPITVEVQTAPGIEYDAAGPGPATPEPTEETP